MSSDRKILGIDPGIADCGWGILSPVPKTKSQTIHLNFSTENFGTIKTSPKSEMSERLLTLYTDLTSIIKEYKPKIIAVENLFFGKNAKTAMIVGQARGVILLLAAKHNLELIEFKPSEIKLALTGQGNAQKNQVQTMVQHILGLKEKPKQDDAADALAIAITAAMTNSVLRYNK